MGEGGRLRAALAVSFQYASVIEGFLACICVSKSRKIVFGMFYGGIMWPHRTSESVVPAGYFGYYDLQSDLSICELETVLQGAKCFSFTPYHM